MREFIDLTGHEYNNWTVLEYAGKSNNGHSLWKCRCTCGRIKIQRSCNIKSGQCKSCGCLKKGINKGIKNANYKHGKSKSKAYKTWLHIKERCNIPTTKAYKYYGGRGIKICERWYHFDNFYSDMGDPPSSKHSIERKNNDGNYCKENCKWATPKEQNNNTRRNVIHFTLNCDWCDKQFTRTPTAVVNCVHHFCRKRCWVRFNKKYQHILKNKKTGRYVK
jgi:hypothetical protein